jgi:predicted site-specific integrase-resolvase
MIGVSYETLYRWCRDGKVRSILYPSGQRRMMESEVRRIAPPPEPLPFDEPPIPERV